MKKNNIIIGALALAMASCATDTEINNGSKEPTMQSISFMVGQRNSIRSRASLLQTTGHYNFGVFAYKVTDDANNIMANYLVGYSDETNKKGYKFGTGQTTKGDVEETVDGKSMWQYEFLGNQEYGYEGNEGFYTKTQTEYMSNVANQYLRYWDKSASATLFYAYAPYINGDGTATFSNSDKTLTIPDGSIEHAYVEDGGTTEHCEYMYAAKQVLTADYGKDVQLMFKHLNAKVNIRFWEDIQGYDVRLIKLTADYDISGAPAIRTGTTGYYNYSLGDYFSKSGFAVNCTNVTAPVVSQMQGVTVSDALRFSLPTAEKIGTTHAEASPSPTTYYAIPKDNTTGFTFHISYELISTTGEVIKVQDATAHVPVEFTNWQSNTAYTYYFKITKDSNGTTGDPGTIDPDDPKTKDDQALFPIVFDNCTVEEWTTIDSPDYNIGGVKD